MVLGDGEIEGAAYASVAVQLLSGAGALSSRVI
jgi:hypothetical protein